MIRLERNNCKIIFGIKVKILNVHEMLLNVSKILKYINFYF